MTYTYTTDSIQANKRDVHRMKVFARKITFQHMRKHCRDVIDFALALGLYSGEELANYPHVKFFKSVFCGRRCFYIAIDGVKYIWCEQEEYDEKTQSKI